MNNKPAPPGHVPPRRADRLLTLDARRRGRVERSAALFRVDCPGCGGRLGSVVAGAALYCPACSLWAEPDEGPIRPRSLADA